MDAQRALLDDLLGAGRNLTDEERRSLKEIKWYDRDVCAYYLVRFCPHDLFFNTRSDLEPCSRIHDPKLKESFENSSRRAYYAPKFEAELVEFCKRLVNCLDNKIRCRRERLAVDIEPSLPPEHLEKIKKLLEQVEALGEEGKVDEAEALMRKVEELNTENEKTMLLQRPNDKVLALAYEQKMELCEVCGSLLRCSDIEGTQAHFTGRQHVGYVMVHDFLAEKKAAKDKEDEEERLRRGKEADDKRKLSEKINRRSGSSDRERYRDRDRDGDKHRDRGRYQREPYDRRSWRGRSRSRSPHGRSSNRRVSRS